MPLSWEARVTLYYDSQSKKVVAKTLTGKTQAEVVEKMKSLGVEPEAEESAAESLSVKAWLDLWQGEYLESVKPSTAYLYGRDIALYILPQLGRYDLEDLTQPIIQKFYNRLLHPASGKKPLSAKTVRDIHGVLHQALEQAVAAGELERNPSSGCKLPKVQKKEITPMENAQICSFLERIEGHTHEYLYKITLFTGLREGEILGLTWDCVDLIKGTLTVKQQMRREQQKGGKYYLSTPKNGKSRTLSISPSVVRLFQYQKQKQLLMRAEAQAWTDTNLVFTNREGNVLSYRTVYDCFKRIAKSIGCPELRFHDLRHQYAVISIGNGDDIKTLQSNLGHASASFTLNVYGHVTEDMKRNSADRMEGYIKALMNSNESCEKSLCENQAFSKHQLGNCLVTARKLIELF